MLLIRVVSDIEERQNDDREARRLLSVRLGGGGRGRRACRADLDRVDPHRLRDVLEVLLAEIGEMRVDPAANVIVGRAGKTNPARLCDALEPRGDIDAVAKNVVALDEHVAEVDADAIGMRFSSGVSAL